MHEAMPRAMARTEPQPTGLATAPLRPAQQARLWRVLVQRRLLPLALLVTLALHQRAMYASSSTCRRFLPRPYPCSRGSRRLLFKTILPQIARFPHVTRCRPLLWLLARRLQVLWT